MKPAVTGGLSRHERGYTSKWEKARLQFLIKNPLCTRCQARGVITPATVVDHVIPHRMTEAKLANDKAKMVEAQALFWRRSNWQSLCSSCHNGSKQQEERSGVVRGFTRDGQPLDPNHHWNR